MGGDGYDDRRVPTLLFPPVRMPEPYVLAILAGIMCLGAFIRATVGFADAVVSVPLMTLVLDGQIDTPLKFATPLMSLCAATAGLALLALDWRRIDVRRAVPLIVGGLFGLPLGVALLSVGDERLLTIALGTFVLAFCLYEAFGKIPERVRDWPGTGYGFGFLAGIFGGIFTMPGPPIVAYGRLQDWPSDRFRAMITGFAVPFGLSMATVHGVTGFWTNGVLFAYACALPGLAAGFVLGNMLHHRVPADAFRNLIRIGLVAMGLMLLVRGWQPAGPNAADAVNGPEVTESVDR